MITLESQTGKSRAVFEPSERGLLLCLEVLDQGQWRRVSAPGPLVAGPHFDLHPKSITRDGNSLRLAGSPVSPASARYTWSGDIVSFGEWFSITIDIESDGFAIGGAGRAEPEILIDLGHLPPYERGNHVWFKTNIENPPQWNHEARGNGFPATYYYDPYRKAEFSMFFDMTSMSWMGMSSAARFHDYRAGFRRRLDGIPSAEIGLIAQGLSGDQFPAGRQRLSWSVAVAHRDDRPVSPTEQEALVELVDRCLPLVPHATNRWPTHATSWTEFAEGTAHDLMSSEHAWREVDGREHLLAYVDGRSDAWVEALEARGVEFDGSGPCLDAALWVLRPLDVIQRAVPNTAWTALHARIESFVHSALLDRQSGMLTGLASRPLEVGCWQYVYLLADAWYVYADRQNAELMSRIREEIDTVLIPLAHASQYVFPLSFDKSTLKKLGPGNNVGVCGTYALLMVDLGRRLGRPDYLVEARRALRVLANVPIDDALQEVFLTAHAIAAADELAEITGEQEWTTMRQYFRAQTLRMMYWFSDRTSERTALVDHVGMFEACLSINYPAFFENLEVDTRLASALHHESDPSALLDVLDKGRRNNFSFFPECSPDMYGAMPLAFIPFEEVPLLDGTIGAGFLGQEIYGAGWTFRAYLLWEAYARSSDREVMIVNCDSYRERTEGPWSGTFFAYNAGETDRTTEVNFPVIREGETAVLTSLSITGAATQFVLAHGRSLTLSLSPRSWSHLTLKVDTRP